jgi:hypothetical protein
MFRTRIAHVYCILMGSDIEIYFLAAAVCALYVSALGVTSDDVVSRETGSGATPLISQARLSLAVCILFHITWIYCTLPHWSVLNVLTVLQLTVLQQLSFHCVLWKTVNNTFIQFVLSVADAGAVVFFA